jgi:PIN domain nuclease of toxin-antitoxin system
VRLLLDTHALLWWFTNDARLSARAAEAIRDGANELIASAVSGFEIVGKHRLGRLPELKVAPHELLRAIERAKMQVLPITFTHAMEAGTMSIVHRDPWDRLLIAQSRLEGLTVVTRDPEFVAAGVAVLW